jgi:hypothetical protein
VQHLRALQQLLVDVVLADQSGPTGQAKPAQLPAARTVGLEVQALNNRCLNYWLIAGSFANFSAPNPRPGFVQSLVAEGQAHPQPGTVFYAPDGRAVAWRHYQSPVADRVDLGELYGRDNAGLAYAYCQFNSPTAQRLAVSVKGRTRVVAFLNGEKAFEAEAEENDRIAWLPLRAGNNHLLLRLETLGGDWHFSLHLPENVVRNQEYRYRVAPAAAAAELTRSR